MLILAVAAASRIVMTGLTSPAKSRRRTRQKAAAANVAVVTKCLRETQRFSLFRFIMFMGIPFVWLGLIGVIILLGILFDGPLLFMRVKPAP
jgi:hypothetical protein